ncbi:MAG: 4Fe-4S dicluster domain-containing protein [Terriglobales bacterium]
MVTENTTLAVSSGPAARSPLPKVRPQAKRLSYHRFRKTIHLVCVLIFFTLPLSNLVRFDVPRQRFYFFGYELWISEFAIIFFSLMFLLFLVAAMAMLYGRVYCGYLCPQMIFSEAAIAAESNIQRFVNKHVGWSATARRRLGRAIVLAVLGISSVILAFVFISYFVEPHDLFQRLMSFDVRTAGGIAGATTTLLTFLDFLLLRQRFCTVVCPYGYLQGMLCDSNTLIVHYRDPRKECIACKKCVRVCQMGIDIRTSPYQIECIHCGECIDACTEILARLGKPSVVHYAWGEHGELLGSGNRPWHQRMGLRDAKRVVVLLVILFYAAGLFTVLAMRRPVLVRLMPDRTTLYRLGPDGTVYNRFRLTAANRGRTPAIVILAIEDLPGAHFEKTENTLVVDPGETLQREFEIAVPQPAQLAPGVNHFRLISQVGNERESLPETFIMPFQDSR